MIREKRNYLKPQDIVILIKIVSLRGMYWSQMDIARNLGISQSEVSEGIYRLQRAGLISDATKSVKKLAVKEFLLHGFQYAFAASPSIIARGMPTAHSAPFFKDDFFSEDEYVWPHPKGTARGEAVYPLYQSVPEAAAKDEVLYEYLSLLEMLRVGRAREKDFARTRLSEIIDHA